MSNTFPLHIAPQEGTRRYDMIAAAVVIAFGAFCLWYSTTHDLIQDESYYWQWSRHLAVGYYDNTPMMAWIIHLFTGMLGNTELGVRAGAVVCACIAAWFLYKLAAETLGGAVGLTTLAAALLNPLFGNGATLMSADPPQLAFWMATAWAGWRAVQVGETATSAVAAKSWGWWLLTGLLAGLTAMSKLNGLLVLPSVLLFLAMDAESRVWLRRPQPYVAAILALLIFSPFVWWNHAHGNAFWIHINAMGHRTEKSQGHFTLKYFGDFFGSQAILLSPFLFLTLLWAIFRLPRQFNAGFEAAEYNVNRALRYFWCLCVVVLAVTLVLSLKSRVEGNWAVAAYLGGLILVGYVMQQAWQSRRAGLRVWHAVSIALAAFLTIFAYVSTLTTLPRKGLVATLDKRTDELYGWDAMAARVRQEEGIVGGNPFVFGVNYRMPSEMAFYLAGQPQTYSLFLKSRSNQYLFWDDEASLKERNAVFVNDDEQPDHLADCRAVFRSVTLAPPLLIYRAPYKKPIRTIQIFRCYGFRGYERGDWQRGW